MQPYAASIQLSLCFSVSIFHYPAKMSKQSLVVANRRGHGTAHALDEPLSDATAEEAILKAGKQPGVRTHEQLNTQLQSLASG